MKGIGRRGVLAAAMAMAAEGAQAQAETRVLTGTVTYRERMALPGDAVVEVQLLDVSRVGAPAQTLAEVTIPQPGQVPARFILTYDPAQIEAGHTYALRARILVQSQLWFTTTAHHRVDPTATLPEQNLLVHRVGARQPSRSDGGPAGRWLAEDIRGGGVIDGLQSVLEISPTGAVSGSGGCNRIAGQARITGERIELGQLAVTRMACLSPAAGQQETRFLGALGDARSFRLDEARAKLILLDAGGREILVFSRM
ncbi:YbaY family lipoprotein [Roseococcus sp. YIM B11640]|uniref:YbaY family lipoprotein n=1 Tax=Roseococcus sp. YIM B11640 TaxID=3133973 RepID=UPI003C7C5DE2